MCIRKIILSDSIYKTKNDLSFKVFFPGDFVSLNLFCQISKILCETKIFYNDFFYVGMYVITFLGS